MNERNEWTARERGLMIGHTWAKGYAGTDLRDLKPIANGRIDERTKDLIAAQLVYSDDIENPTAFWGGFAHGVAAYLVENGITAQDPT
jgi:hypothetical protein